MSGEPRETKARRVERLKRELNPWAAYAEIERFAREGFAAIPPEWLKEINDVGLTAIRHPDAGEVGFSLRVGGGLSTDPRLATRLDAFARWDQVLAYTVWTVFVIDPKKTIRLMITYPQTTGRNFDEILRVIDSLHLTDGYKVATPVNCKPGEDVIIVPAVSDAEAKERFPGGWRALTPYLRLTLQPDRPRPSEALR